MCKSCLDTHLSNPHVKKILLWQLGKTEQKVGFKWYKDIIVNFNRFGIRVTFKTCFYLLEIHTAKFTGKIQCLRFVLKSIWDLF